MKNFVETMTWYSNQHFYFIPWNVDKFMVSKPSLYFQTTNTCRNYFNTIDLVQIHGFQTTQRWHFHSFQTILLFHTIDFARAHCLETMKRCEIIVSIPWKDTKLWYTPWRVILRVWHYCELTLNRPYTIKTAHICMKIAVHLPCNTPELSVHAIDVLLKDFDHRKWL